jgi:site-specific DNA recombinase
MRCVIYLRVSTKEQAENGLGEEGFSIPAQREACVRHLRDKGWELVDEYADRGESARSADRPQLKAMLARIAEDADVDAVVVHKVDRLARNLEDHVAIRALLRRRGVTLVSVTENLEETASGRLVEGIHALMAEFYSANLATEIKKGMGQKAKMGGWPHAAPLGYLNVRETIGGRQVAHIVADPERAPHVSAAFELYATGEWTLERLVRELAHRGLRNRGRRDRDVGPIGVSALANILANKAYAGIVSWDGIEYQGLHEPLIDTATFNRVQDFLAARSARGTRERRHNHYLKGTLFCGVCGRALSVQLSKGRYEYLYCLGQKNRNPTGCREPYVPAGDLEAQVEQLYKRIQLPKSWLGRLREELESEITSRQRRNSSEREFLTRKLAKAETERRKLLDAYYAGAIDVSVLKNEQARIGTDIRGAEERLAAVDAHLAEWQEILETAMRFATNCAKAYARASTQTRRRFNQAVFTRIDVRDGKIADVGYHPPFDLLFSSSEFEYGDLVELTGFEPVASWLQTRRSDQLSYSPEIIEPTGPRANPFSPRARARRIERTTPGRSWTPPAQLAAAVAGPPPGRRRRRRSARRRADEPLLHPIVASSPLPNARPRAHEPWRDRAPGAAVPARSGCSAPWREASSQPARRSDRNETPPGTHRGRQQGSGRTRAPARGHATAAFATPAASRRAGATRALPPRRSCRPARAPAGRRPVAGCAGGRCCRRGAARGAASRAGARATARPGARPGPGWRGWSRAHASRRLRAPVARRATPRP